MPTRSDIACAATALRDHLFVSGTDLFALGHYPGNPVYPGALMLDRMLTMAVALAGQALGQRAWARTVKRVQYLGVVMPGDVVGLDVSIVERDADQISCLAVASVHGNARVQATIVCVPDVETTLPPVDCDIAHEPAVLTHAEIARLLPHRYPFLLLDTVRTFQPGEHILATKVVNRESPILGARPPATYPASLAIESFGQAGVALFCLSQANSSPAQVLVGLMRDVTVLRTIPYDTVLTLDVRIERLRTNAVVFGGDIRIGDERVIHVGSLVVMIGPEQPSQGA